MSGQIYIKIIILASLANMLRGLQSISVDYKPVAQPPAGVRGRPGGANSEAYTIEAILAIRNIKINMKLKVAKSTLILKPGTSRIKAKQPDSSESTRTHPEPTPNQPENLSESSRNKPNQTESTRIKPNQANQAESSRNNPK